jgi:hypothetical protein
VNVRLRARGPCVDVGRSAERSVGVIDPTKTDVCVCQRDPCRQIDGIELHRALERSRGSGEALRILMEAAEQRPRLGVLRLDANGALQIGRRFTCRAFRSDAAREQLQRKWVVRPLADDNTQVPGSRVDVLQLERDEAEEVSRVEIVGVRSDTAFEVRTRVRVLACLNQLTRPARALVRSGNLAVSRTERAQECNRRQEP